MRAEDGEPEAAPSTSRQVRCKGEDEHERAKMWQINKSTSEEGLTKGLEEGPRPCMQDIVRLFACRACERRICCPRQRLAFLSTA